VTRLVAKTHPKVIPFIALSMVLYLSLVSTPARAEDKAGAKKHFDVGISLLQVEDYAGAAAEFEISVKLYPTKNGLFNLANCLKALHQYDQALARITRLNQLFGNNLDQELRDAVAKLDSEIRALVAPLTIQVDRAGALVSVDGREKGKSPLAGPVLLGPGEHTVAVSLDGYEPIERRVNLVAGAKSREAFVLEQVLAELSIKADLAGAAVWVDGAKVGETPLQKAITLTAGQHLIKVTRQGYRDNEREVTLALGDKITLDFSLAAERLSSSAPPPVTATEGEAVSINPAVTSQEPTDRPGLSPLFWVGVAGTAVVGVAAGVFWGLAFSKYSDFTEQRKTYSESWSDDDRSKAKELGNNATSLRTVAIGMTIGAGVLAATTIAVFMRDRSASESETGPALATPGGIMVRF
jgi:hypothetical protein